MPDGSISSGMDAVQAAPEWFRWAIEQTPRRAIHRVEDAAVETLSWGPDGAPGVLLLHGYAAHAHWWSFIAPYLAKHRRVVAMSFSGMGASDWRASYSVDQYAREALGVAEAEGLFAGEEKPAVVAHSLGGVVLLRLVAAAGERLAGAVLIDPLLKPTTHSRDKANAREHKLHASPEALVSHFQASMSWKRPRPVIADWVARQGIAEIRRDGSEAAYCWRFDPNLWDRLELRDVHDVAATSRCPLALIVGENSDWFPARAVSYFRKTAAPGTPIVSIPECGHHVLIDQPIALISTLEALLASQLVSVSKATRERADVS